MEPETSVGSTRDAPAVLSVGEEEQRAEEIVAVESDQREEFSADENLWNQMVEVVNFSGPAVGLWLCGPLMSLIDTAVIGQGSSVELAALGPGTVFIDNTSYVFMFLSIATSNLVATSLARQDKDEVQHQISNLLFIGLGCGVFMLVFTRLFGPWVLTAFIGAKNTDIIAASNTYVQVSLSCKLPTLIAACLYIYEVLLTVLCVCVCVFFGDFRFFFLCWNEILGYVS